MIRLKEAFNQNDLEKYGFEKKIIKEWNSQKRCVYYRTVYSYPFYKIYEGNLQSVEIYIEPFISTYGQTIYNAREVVAIQHAFKCDKAVNLIAKLITEGILEYIE